MGLTRTITADKGEILAELQRMADERREVGRDTTQRVKTYRQGVADGLELALDLIKDWQIPTTP